MTTPDTEVKPTEDRTAGDFWAEKRDGRWQLQMRHRGPGSSFCVAQINHWADNPEALTTRIADACNAYEPMRKALQGYIDNCTNEECEYCIKARAALKGIPKPATPKEAAMTEAQIKHMVDRFLMWKLPEHFNPDGGISFEPVGNKGTPHEYRHNPVGTNLLSAEQATAMVRHMLEGVPQPASEDYQADASAPALSENVNGAEGWQPEGSENLMALLDAIQRLEKELPGWWWSVGSCHVSADASIGPINRPWTHASIGPDSAGRDAHLLEDKLFDGGFHCDLRQPATCAESLNQAIDEALAARRDAELNFSNDAECDGGENA